MADMDELDRVIAGNLRQLIAERGWRHVELASRLNANGFAWTANRVAQVTTDRRRLTLLELAALCATFAVPLSRFLDGDRDVPIPAGQPVPLAMVRESLTAGTVTASPTAVTVTRYVYVPTDEEEAAVKRLGLPNVGELHRLAKRALGTTSVVEERDRRVGDPAGVSKRSLQAKRGHAMRAILTELRAYNDTHPEIVGDLADAENRSER